MLQDAPLHAQSWHETIGELEHYYFPPYITLAHLFSAPIGWEIQPRSLSQYQLQYVVSGAAHYHIEGQDYYTKRGDLLFHRPNERHYVKLINNEPYVCISIVFHFGITSFSPDNLLEGKHELGNFSDDHIEKKLGLIVNHYRQPGQVNQLLCQGHLLQLMAQLSEVSRQNRLDSNTTDKTNAKLILVRNYIANHYNENLQYREFETIAGLSKNYLTNKFRQAFGMTPFEYMIWTRMEKAKELAIHSNLSIGEIAQLVGYSDVHTFGKMFKKKAGVSLSQFCSSIVTIH